MSTGVDKDANAHRIIVEAVRKMSTKVDVSRDKASELNKTVNEMSTKCRFTIKAIKNVY